MHPGQYDPIVHSLQPVQALHPSTSPPTLTPTQIVVHSTTTQQPLVLLLPKKKDGSLKSQASTLVEDSRPYSFSSIFLPRLPQSQRKQDIDHDASVESSLVKNNINLVTAEPTTDTLKQSFDTRKLTPTVQPVLPTRRTSGQAAENEKDLSSSSNDGFRLSVLVPCQDPDTGFTKKCLLVKKTL
eukprot:03622.XXX_69525_70371_1 [CDS] Oithona nana genome sequencing.